MNLIKPLKNTFELNNTGRMKLFSFNVPENKAGELNICVKNDPDRCGYRYYTELRNRFNKLLGYEHFAHFDGSDNISGLYINVEPEYRRKKYYIGEILRLASIIEMLENNVKNLVITSKETAVYFHFKYKFRPTISSFEARDRILKNIAEDKGEDFADLAIKARKLQYQRLHRSELGIKNRQLCKDTSILLNEYLNRAYTKQKQSEHKISWPVEMTLHIEDIKANKDYFNSLFKKHKIDYSI